MCERMESQFSLRPIVFCTFIQIGYKIISSLGLILSIVNPFSLIPITVKLLRRVVSIGCFHFLFSIFLFNSFQSGWFPQHSKELALVKVTNDFHITNY